MRLDRIEREKSVLVDVINCRRQPDLNDTSMMCQTIDVSEEGMQFSSELDLPVNTRLGLRLDLETSLYRLEGEVRWAREDGQYCVGLLLDTESPDFVSWTRMFQLGS
jgi:hypothetical protein